MTSTIRYYVDGRLFEWVISTSMLELFAITMIWPDTLHASVFQWVVVVMPPAIVQVFMFLFGFARLVGLLLNGHRFMGVKLGPVIRSVTAVGCAVMWAQFFWALVLFSAKQGFPSPEIPFWQMFVVGELYVAYRAAGETWINSSKP